MAARITDTWGERSPHARGTAWPTRVDRDLDVGVEESRVDRRGQTACVRSSNGCGSDTAVQVGRTTRTKVAAPQAIVVAP